MSIDNESEKQIASIYKYVYKNPNIHRNIARKELVFDGKISKTKFPQVLASLITLGAIKEDKQNLTINPSLIEIGVLRRDDEGFYVVTSKSNKHYKVSQGVGTSYDMGTILDVIVNHQEGEKQAIVLGRSQKLVEMKKQKQAQKELGAIENKSETVAKEKMVDEKIDSQPSRIETKSSTNFVKKKETENNLLLGRVVKVGYTELVFIPNKKGSLPRQISILNNPEDVPSFQNKICVMKLSNETNPADGGTIVEVKGDAGNPIHEYDAIAQMYGSIMSWSGENLEKEIARIPKKIDVSKLNLISEEEALYKQKDHIVDLRELNFVAVDPPKADDMDDVIFSRFNEDGNIEYYTAIANITKFVDLNSEIGRLYIAGAFTTYAPNKAYYILPPELSSGVGSLKPGEDRLALVFKTVVDPKNGEVVSENIYDALVRSRHKYSYDEAQAIVDKIDDEYEKTDLEYKNAIGEPLTDEEQVLMNYYSAQVREIAFDKRRMLHFESNKDREVVFDEGLQDVVDIKPVKQLAYNKVIENFMLTANENAANFCYENNIDNIYRIHSAPNPRKMDRATEFFELLGIDFDGSLSVEETKSLLEMVKGTKDEEVINDFLIRMQSRAVYSDKPYTDEQIKENIYNEPLISHHGLQSKRYSHSTAIIRRVVDYVTHYNILAKMHGKEPIGLDTIREIVEHANERQLDIDQAEKDFADISNVFYCEKHIGETVKGKIIKMRYSCGEEGYDDEIVVIVKNDDTGITAEIPLSQVIGRNSAGCYLSPQHCAVFDERGNVVLTLCKPLEFIIEKADRVTMTVTGKTNKTLVNNVQTYWNGNQKSHLNKKYKDNHYKKYKPNKSKIINKQDETKEKDFDY